MLIFARAPGFARRVEKIVKVASAVFLLAIVAAIIRQNWESLPSHFADVGIAAVLLNVSTMASGFFLAKLTKLSKPQSVTIGLEVGLQNGTTALLITATILANATMAIPAAVYSLIMFGTGALFAILVTRDSPQRDSVNR